MKVKEEMKIKYLLGILGISAIALASCDNTASGETTMSTTINNSTTQPETTNQENNTTNNQGNDNEPNNNQNVDWDKDLVQTKVYMVGDSTMCSFDDDYYYPRYGYGTQMQNYLSKKASVVNLALSGRSSLSFTTESNYSTLKNDIKQGDYLIIGFGHNDEKNDDATRYRSANYSNIDAALADSNSFQSSLYNNYVKLALDKGAFPILASPIVRASESNDYTGSTAHITENDGDYRKAVEDLATKYSIPFIDLTTISKTQYSQIGFSEAVYYHAMSTGKFTTEDKTQDKTEPNLKSYDKTHLNVYGAKNTAYNFAQALLKTNSTLKNYVDTSKEAPTKDKDLVKNSSFVVKDYEAVNWSSYVGQANRFVADNTKGIYGTVFGELGGDKSSQFIAIDTTDGYRVGNDGTRQGKFYLDKDNNYAFKSFGFAFAFKQISASENYKLTAKAKVATINDVTKLENGTQTGFGLMIRDDCYIPTNDASIVSNFISAGFNTAKSKSAPQINFAVANNTIINSNDVGTAALSATTEYEFEISKIGQNITVKTTFNGTTYTETYYDFDLLAIDTNYYYLGMWATRGTVIDFTNVEYTFLGTYEGA
ncbi:MAG: hypothetical protein IJS83_00655 [Acholeplasmatales bacterium]|nr:hypothetical protein [Acholeplasmatales bacterium]